MKNRRPLKDWRKVLALVCAITVIGSMAAGTGFSVYGAESDTSSQEQEINTDDSDTEDQSVEESKEVMSSDADESDQNTSADTEKKTDTTADTEKGESADQKTDSKDNQKTDTSSDTAKDTAVTPADVDTNPDTVGDPADEGTEEESVDEMPEEQTVSYTVTFKDEKNLITIDQSKVTLEGKESDDLKLSNSDFPTTKDEPYEVEGKEEYYYFDGWYSGDKEYTSLTTITEDVTLEAKWVQAFPITFHADTNPAGGKLVDKGSKVDSIKVWLRDEEDKNVIESQSTEAEEGYELDGWYTKASFADGSKITIDEKTGKSSVYVNADNYTEYKDIYVKWIELYDITFAVNYEGGVNGTAQVRRGEKIQKTDIPTRQGYTANWYTNEECTKKADFAKEITEKQTFYADWTANSYTVVFDGNGATGGSTDSQTVSWVEETEKDNITIPDNGYEKTGYKPETTESGEKQIVVWNTKADGTGDVYKVGDTFKNLTDVNGGTVTLYAQWSPINYEVLFNRNDGENAGNITFTDDKGVEQDYKQECMYDEEVKIAVKDPDRTGYTFVGWCANADGSGKIYKQNESYSNLTTDDGVAETLYAIWQDNTAPVITYKSRRSAPGDDSKYLETKNDIDFSNCDIIYRVTITDEGTGVNPKSIKYAVVSGDVDSSAPDDDSKIEWMDASATKDNNEYEFDVKVPEYGILLVKAADNAENPSSNDYAIAKANANESKITKIRTLVMESNAPEIEVTVDDAENYQRKHSYKLKITEKPESGNSGLQQIKWDLYDELGERVESYSKEIHWDAPKNLSDANSSFEQTNNIDNEDLDGKYKLVVTALDNCGNESTKEAELCFDNTEPTIDVEMQDGRKDGDDWYYNASNNDITINIGEVEKSKPKSGIKKLTISINEQEMVLVAPEKKADYKNPFFSVVLKYTPDENKEGTGSYTAYGSDGTTKIEGTETIEAPDGDVKVCVEVEDYATNKTTLGSGTNYVKIKNLSHEEAFENALFKLDTTAPKLVSIETKQDANKDNSGNGRNNADIYNGDFYYNENIKTTFGFEEANIDTFKVSYKRGDIEECVEKAENSIELELTEEGKYSDFTVYGIDKAGNLMKKDEKFSVTPGIVNDLTDPTGDIKDGTATLTYNKIIDTTPPKATITHEPKATAYTYKDGDETPQAYISSSIDTWIEVKDTTWELDGTKISYGPEKNILKGKSTAVETIKQPQPWTDTEDGHYKYAVYGTDRAGNALIVTESLNGIDENTRNAEDSYTVKGCATAYESQYELIIDKTKPELTMATTDVGANHKYQKNNGKWALVSDNDAPYDNAFYYMADKVNTSFEISDTNPYYLETGYNDKKIVNSNESKKDIVLQMTDEGDYENIYIYGYDKAHNPLVVSEKFVSKSLHDVVVDGKKTVETKEASANNVNAAEDGKVLLKYGKILDRTAPEATITHKSDKPAFMYDQEAYISGNIDTQIAVSDTTWPLDGSKLYYGPVLVKGKETDILQGAAEDKIINLTWPDTEDGHYKYAVYGTDRAGNAVTVTELLSNIENVKGSAKNEYADQKGKATSYTPQYELIIDKTNPTYTLSLTDVDNNKKNVDGSTAYYNKTINGTFTIGETNFDQDRIGAGTMQDAAQNYYSQTKAKWVTFKDGANLKSAKDQTYALSVVADTKNHATDGSWRFAIQGCDKAGNPLIKSTAESKKSGYQETVEYAADAGQFWTNKKVMDTVAPDMALNISGKKSYYSLTKGPSGNTFDTKIYDPFRSETNATVVISGSDYSPMNITYGITSTLNGQSRIVTDQYVFKDSNSFTEKMKGEQIFLPNNIVVTDRAGNSTKLDEANNIYLDVTVPQQDITAPVATVTAVTAITGRSADGRGLYNKGVTLNVSVKDPNPKTSSSGLRTVTYKVYADGQDVTSQAVVRDGKKTSAGTLTFFTNDGNLPKAAGKNPSLTSEHSFTIDLPSGGGSDATFETNNIKVVVQAVDNAGNQSDPNKGGTINLGIDTIGPEITVSYDNNSAQNEKYFKETRTATVRTIERNVDNSKISIRTEVGVPGSWSYAAGGDADGNKDIWTKTLSYNRDADYTLNISGTDALGNPAKVTYTGTAPQAFTVDRTAPVINVSFDNNSAQHGKYYKANRTASITINEHNFRSSDVKINQSATAPRGGSMSSPGASGFSSSGDSRHASISYTTDGNYRFDVSYTDLAGNAAKAVTVEEFVIDKTPPTLTIENVTENTAYSGEIAPRVVFDDANFSRDLISFILTGLRGTDHSDLVPNFISTGAFGGVYDIGNIAIIRKNDDVYTAKATITDLAGNSAEAEITFSVNRFGSTYDYNDDKTTENLMDAYYTNQEKKLYVREINVNGLKENKVTVYRDGENKVLKEGTDYKVSAGSYGGARTYIYELDAKNFEAEGNYSVIIQSEDEAGNTNTTSTIREDDNVISELPVEFAIDKTNPELQVTGLNNPDGISRYYESKATIQIKPADNMSLSAVEMKLDEDVDTKNYKGKELTKTLDENQETIPYEFKSSPKTQTLEVISYDAAGNESGVQTYKVLVTRNVAAQYFNRRPLFFGSIAAVAVIIGLLAARRKRKRDDSEEAA